MCLERMQRLLVGAIACTCLVAGVALADPPPRPGPGKPIHYEEPGDQPVVTTEVRTTAPLPRAQLTRNGYASVQVNVDEAGNNIVGDAANEPTIAIDPTNPNRIVIGWRQFDSIQSDFREAGWAYSHDGGQTWTFPGVLENGVFRSDPVLDADAQGNFYYYSLQSGFVCDMFKSADGGVTWSMVTAFGGDKEWMVVDRTGGPSDGNIYGIWSTAGGPYINTPFTRSFDGGQTFDGPFPLPDTPVWGTLTVDPDGVLYLVGIPSYTYWECVVDRSANAADPASTPTFIRTYVDLGGILVPGGFDDGSPNPGGLLGQMWIAADHSDGPTRGNLYVLASLWPYTTIDPMDVFFVRSTDGGVTWSAPIRVNDDPPAAEAWQWFGTLSVAPNGRIDAVWNDTRGRMSAIWSELYYTYSHDGGQTWARSIRATPAFNSVLGWPQQNKIGDYYHMISDNVVANLAYSATFNNEEDVYFIRLGDCNANGVHDGLDLAAGTSADVNTNSVPDECEPDCNANAVPDEWDIAVGTSLDCNANGAPDECDVASGVSADCNGNTHPDECDIATGVSGDCNDNATPDECDVASGVSLDCNVNAAPDECELTANPNLDCNGNAILDECDIAAGASADCNVNGTPDECDLAAGFTSSSPRMSPLGSGFPQTYVVTAPRVALPGATVTLAFEAVGDLNFSSEKVNVYMNDVWLDEVFGAGTGAHDCPAVPDVDQVELTADVWNAAAAGGVVTIRLETTSNVDPQYCYPRTWIALVVSYDAAPASGDCNTNAIPDECDIAGGVSADTNTNGVPDECETCRGDANGDGSVDEADVPYFAVALRGQAAWVSYHQAQSGAWPTCPWANCDANGDGRVTYNDIKPFVSLMDTTCDSPE